jgi:hypothetical protein
MKKNAGFLNEYVDNLSRIESMGGYLEESREHLIELRELLTSAIHSSRSPE